MLWFIRVFTSCSVPVEFTSSQPVSLTSHTRITSHAMESFWAISHVSMELKSSVLETVSASVIRVHVMGNTTAHCICSCDCSLSPTFLSACSIIGAVCGIGMISHHTVCAANLDIPGCWL